MSVVGSILAFLFAVARSLVGGIIFLAGWEMLQGEGLLALGGYRDPFFALFVMALGSWAIYQGLVAWFIAWLTTRNQRSG